MFGFGRRLDAEGGEHLAVEARGVIERRHVVDRTGASRAWITALSRTLQKSPSLRRSSRGPPIAARQSRICGWTPIERNSLTECWVGLILSSPAVGMKGRSVRMDEDHVAARQVVAEAWRIA